MSLMPFKLYTIPPLISAIQHFKQDGPWLSHYFITIISIIRKYLSSNYPPPSPSWCHWDKWMMMIVMTWTCLASDDQRVASVLLLARNRQLGSDSNNGHISPDFKVWSWIETEIHKTAKSSKLSHAQWRSKKFWAKRNVRDKLIADCRKAFA